METLNIALAAQSASKSKPRHPNQYTYNSSNPKPAPKKSGPNKSSPKKQKSRGGGNGGSGNGYHNHNGTIDVQSNEEWIEGMAGWGLPDHLKNLEALLDKDGPKKLRVRTFLGVDNVETEGSTSSRAFVGTKLIPDPSRTLEYLPSKIKWPSKRTSMNDIKKRVKNLMDYMGKLQIEMVKRDLRNKVLFGEDFFENEQGNDEGGSEKAGREEIRVMGDELMKELVKFNERFFTAGGNGKGKEK
jgi:hypothetical protein